jgi:hypothetical protein
LFRPRDTFGTPQGPGQPATLLHALGERDDWKHVDAFDALLLDLYALFAKPGAHPDFRDELGVSASALR